MNLSQYIKYLSEASQGTTTSKLSVNTIVAALQQAKREIENEAKYKGQMWKQDALKALKVEALVAFQAALDEAHEVNRQYEEKINTILNEQYTGARVNKNDIEVINYELTALKAELNMNDDKNKVIDKYLATQTGAKAVMLMFSEKDLDLGIWSQSVYKQAFIKSKTREELDFEVQKAPKINELKAQQAAEMNIGSVLAVQAILNGSVQRGTPSLERQFDLDIAACDKAMSAERDTLKAELNREMATQAARKQTTINVEDGGNE